MKKNPLTRWCRSFILSAFQSWFVSFCAILVSFRFCPSLNLNPHHVRSVRIIPLEVFCLSLLSNFCQCLWLFSVHKCQVSGQSESVYIRRYSSSDKNHLSQTRQKSCRTTSAKWDGYQISDNYGSILTFHNYSQADLSIRIPHTVPKPKQSNDVNKL